EGLVGSEMCYKRQLQLFTENHNRFPGYQLIMNNLFEILLCLLLRFKPSHMNVNQVKQYSCLLYTSRAHETL
ncbi:hypothetical protein ACQ4LK_26050, partial [Bacillus pumilus]